MCSSGYVSFGYIALLPNNLKWRKPENDGMHFAAISENGYFG